MATPTVVRAGLFALAIVALGFVPGVSGADSPSAKGEGELMINGNVRTFSFHAIKRHNGDVTGKAEVHIPATDSVVHMGIDCLGFVTTNTVLVSGTITKSNVSGLSVGQPAIFEAQDNGKGTDSPPDRISRLFPAGTLDCTASNVDLGLMDLQHGNIKVRP